MTQNQLEASADAIVNHFFGNCQAVVSKKDYDFVLEYLELINTPDA